MPPTTSRRQVALLLQERHHAMGSHKFKPENYAEIQRVLGTRFVPDLNRVFANAARGDAASAYLRRLHKDVGRSQEGYYGHIQAMPLQIKSLSVKKEDPRNFKSLLIPKHKLAPMKPVVNVTPPPPPPNPLRPRAMQKNVLPPVEVPPLDLQGDRSSYVPHKSFSPHKPELLSLSVNKEDPRSFKSLLIPKHKLAPMKPVVNVTPPPPPPNPLRPRAMQKNVLPPVEVPPLDLQGDRSSYVPHKSFSPHSHTHIHVLFKQNMPSSVTPHPRRGPGSIASSERSNGATTTLSTDTSRSHRHHLSLKTQAATKLSPRGAPGNVNIPEETELDHDWPQEDVPAPFAHPKFAPTSTALPHVKKQQQQRSQQPPVVSPRMPDKTPINTLINNNNHNNNNNNNHFNFPAAPGLLSPYRKSPVPSPVQNALAAAESPRETRAVLPSRVAAALAAETHSSASLLKLDLPPGLAAVYNKNLPASYGGERPRAIMLNGGRARHPALPSIPSSQLLDKELLAITSVQHTNAIIQLAA